MSLDASLMLDFSKLTTPRKDREVLVAPASNLWIEAARANRKRLRAAEYLVAGVSLAACRRATREAVLGSDDPLVFVSGHQPALIHPGVWAKHVMASRAAATCDGAALNIVVDNDAAKESALIIPTVENESLRLQSIPIAPVATGCTYEQIPRLEADQLAVLEEAIEAALGDRFSRSLMPKFLSAFRKCNPAADWVDQAVDARCAVEREFGVEIEDRRVGKVWGGPLLCDMLASAPRFVASYNRALAEYRRENHVRGGRRPIPDLVCEHDCIEAPVWVFRRNEPRQRLFVAHRGDSIRFLRGGEEIGAARLATLSTADGEGELAKALGEWQLRPRALTLTIWARLLLADLFVHGIGGAKYDRITDSIIADYYGLQPPHMACVSATLLLGLPRRDTTARTESSLRNELRDLRYNPQRHVTGGDDLDPFLRKREELLKRSEVLANKRPPDRQARREAFQELRGVTSAILALRPEAIVTLESKLARAREEVEQDRIAGGREYFFGLYDRPKLEQLLDSLPTKGCFRV